jgi:hypothetical protein
LRCCAAGILLFCLFGPARVGFDLIRGLSRWLRVRGKAPGNDERCSKQGDEHALYVFHFGLRLLLLRPSNHVMDHMVGQQRN